MVDHSATVIFTYICVCLLNHACFVFEFLKSHVIFFRSADEDKWNDLLRDGLTYGGGTVLSEDFFKAVDRRIERTLMRTVSNL